MASSKELSRYTLIGIGVAVLGAITSLAGAVFAHFTGLSETNDVGVEIYPSIPRGWILVTIGQIISTTGVFLFMGGLVLAFLYKREMTWARAALGATLFSALMMVLFGVIPNEWLTLAQGQLDWSAAKTFVPIPSWLVLGNELEISAAAVKDMISGGYSVVMLGVVAIAMVKGQEWSEKQRSGPPPAPVSPYGRPVKVAEED